ncbi:hypothetical protein AcW2_006646 [Taiwanofungus camphoratus]|nr:hypothetical protein AcW2_006646 [Antrodia cinnamomea]
MAAQWPGDPNPYPPYPGFLRPGHSRSLSTNHGFNGMPQAQHLQPGAPGSYNPSPSMPRPQPYYTPSHPSVAPPPVPSGSNASVSLLPGSAPPMLSPAHGSSASGDYFSQGAGFPQPHLGCQIRYTRSAPVPPLPRKPDFSQPPRPPKPYSLITATATHLANNPEDLELHLPSPKSSSPAVPPKTYNEEEALKRALELSARETEEHRNRTLELEEEELALALQESLKLAPGPPVTGPNLYFPSASVAASTSASPADSPFMQYSQPPLSMPTQIQSPPPYDPTHTIYESSNHGTSSSVRPARSKASLHHIQDEAVRREAEEDKRSSSLEHHEDRVGPEVHKIVLPKLASAVFTPASKSAPAAPVSHSIPLAEATPQPYSNPAAPASMLRSISADAALPSREGAPRPQGNLTGSLERIGENETYARPSRVDTSTPAAQSNPTSPRPSPRVPARHPTVNGDSSPPVISSASNAQHVPEDFLRGVSMNFGVPTITAALTPMQGVIPNVIPLSWDQEQCPPFHIRAPSWRGLLKLMARLSSTRVEPAVEAIAKIKTEMRLRVVVSFVKVHNTSNDWHTVLFLTIDHPAPGDNPLMWKYRTEDTSVLPYSYSLASPLAILREGADAPMSKFYTISSTPETPYPKLPITFPDLAAYLATTLDVSRNAGHDTSVIGLRRLAKILDAIYPNDRPALNPAEKSGMREKLKHFVGLGGKSSRNRNAETYDLVTPFVADDFGR